MQRLQLVPPITSEDFHALSIQYSFEKGRSDAMQSQLLGERWELSMMPIIRSLENTLGSCYANFMVLSDNGATLITVVPEETVFQSFITVLEGLTLVQKPFACHAAFLDKKSVFCEDILATQNYSNVDREARVNKLLASWSQPVLCVKEKVLGVLTVYFHNQRLPSQEEQSILKLAAETTAILMQHSCKTSQLNKEKMEMKKQLIDRGFAATEAQSLLKKAVQQRVELQSDLLELENMAALGTMMSSLTHEINTPIGVAITASSCLADMQRIFVRKTHNQQLKKSELELFFQESRESSDIILRNLMRADKLINSFKQLSIDQHSQELRHFRLCDYVFEILLSLKPRLKTKPHKFCVDISPDLEIFSNPGAISQLLINLIMNSAQHAFDPGSTGKIIIQTKINSDQKGENILQLDYKDNGKGMNQETIANIYKPFFTLARETGGTGLGMHICNNIVMKVLKGKIDCYSEPDKGVHFVIQIPLNAVFEQ